MYFNTTAPLKFRIRLLNSDPTERIVLQTYVNFWNRLDVYVDDNYFPSTNAVLNSNSGKLTYETNTSAITVISVTSDCGSNFYDTSTQLLHIVVCGGKTIDARLSLAVQHDLTIDSDEAATTSGADITSKLAQFLNVDSSKVRLVRTVENTATITRRRRDAMETRHKRATVDPTNTTTYTVQISDSPCATVSCSSTTLTFTSDNLKQLANDIINAYLVSIYFNMQSICPILICLSLSL